jgi:hypothetical protein
MAIYSAGENPFRVERLHALPYWEASFDWEALLLRCDALGLRGALVGKHGHGKTTLLLELGERLASRGEKAEYLCIGDDARIESIIAPQPDTIYLCDGAERLSPAAWLAFRWRMRPAHGLLITAHAPGRLPTLHTCRTTPETVIRLLEALDPPALETLLPRAHVLFEQYRGDCRKILFALYDEYAGRLPGSIGGGAPQEHAGNAEKDV